MTYLSWNAPQEYTKVCVVPIFHYIHNLMHGSSRRTNSSKRADWSFSIYDRNSGQSFWPPQSYWRSGKMAEILHVVRKLQKESNMRWDARQTKSAMKRVCLDDHLLPPHWSTLLSPAIVLSSWEHFETIGHWSSPNSALHIRACRYGSASDYAFKQTLTTQVTLGIGHRPCSRMNRTLNRTSNVLHFSVRVARTNTKYRKLVQETAQAIYIDDDIVVKQDEEVFSVHVHDLQSCTSLNSWLSPQAFTLGLHVLYELRTGDEPIAFSWSIVKLLRSPKSVHFIHGNGVYSFLTWIDEQNLWPRDLLSKPAASTSSKTSKFTNTWMMKFGYNADSFLAIGIAKANERLSSFGE